MIRVTKTWIRPNTNIKLFLQTDAGKAFSAYRDATYGNKLSNETRSLSQDGLTWTYSVTWSSAEDRNAMLADPTIQSYAAQGNAYNSANGIFVSDDQIVNI